MRLRPTPRQVEIGYPWLGGFIAWALAVRLLPNWVYAGGAVRTLADPIVNVAAIAIAFFVAVAVMLGTLKADPLIRELQRIDAFPTMLSYLRSAIYAWGAVIVVSFIVKIVPENAVVLGVLFVVLPGAIGSLPQYTWYGTLVPLWVAAVVADMLTGHRVVRVLFGLLRHRDPRLVRTPPPEHPEDDDEPLALPPERRRRAVR